MKQFPYYDIVNIFLYYFYNIELIQVFKKNLFIFSRYNGKWASVEQYYKPGIYNDFKQTLGRFLCAMTFRHRLLHQPSSQNVFVFTLNIINMSIFCKINHNTNIFVLLRSKLPYHYIRTLFINCRFNMVFNIDLVCHPICVDSCTTDTSLKHESAVVPIFHEFLLLLCSKGEIKWKYQFREAVTLYISFIRTIW